jgi:tellurite resistance protein TehA-like permease
MGTGIVSVALSMDGERALSHAWLWLTLATFGLLVVLTVARLMRDRAGFVSDLRRPVALALVAGTAVVGSRLEIYGWRGTALALLIVGTGTCLGLSIAVRQLPSAGVSFLVTVAPQSLAVLAAEVSGGYRTVWLIYPALAACGVGLLLYPLALRSFDLRELVRGAGDHWVAGGALAISALATSELSTAATRTYELHSAAYPLHVVSVVVWVFAILWLAVLLVAELISPRIHYEDLRWSTVFPVGMYAAASFAVARVAKLPAVHSFATVWTWVAVAVWLLVAGGLARRELQRAVGAVSR